MREDKLLEVICQYQQDLSTYLPIRASNDRWKPTSSIPDRVSTLQHLRWMLHEMEKFVASGQIDKAFRWLGFVQGVLWMTGAYTIGEMKDHNRGGNREGDEVGSGGGLCQEAGPYVSGGAAAGAERSGGSGGAG